MPEFLQRNPLVMVLAAVAVALLIVIGFETGWGSGLRTALPPPSTVRSAAVDAKLLPPVADAAPEAAYPETGNRPLFTPTRRPAPAPEAVGSMVKGQYVLQGITILGPTRIAMLREKTGSKVHRMEKGGDLNGVTVAEIETDRVTLRQGGDSEVVSLVVSRGGGAPAPAAPPSTPATAMPGPFRPPQPGAPAGAPPAGAPPVPGAPSATRPMTATVNPAIPVPPASMGAGTAAAPGSTNAAPAKADAAMTPEELLARRRARRAQQAQ